MLSENFDCDRYNIIFMLYRGYQEYSPILGALQYYAKINAAWSLLWSSHLSTAIKQADYVNEIHGKSSSISAV